MKPLPEVYDNTRVQAGTKRNYYSNEYLAISMRDKEDYRPYHVSVYRYCVPGRCDTYSFALTHGSPKKVSYFSDGWQDLPKTMKMVAKDFNRPQVVEMVLNAFSAERVVLHYRHDFIHLLEVIAPNSKTLKALEKLCQETMQKRADRLVAEGKISAESARSILAST